MKAVGLFTVKLTTSKTVATYGAEKHSQTSLVQSQHSFSLPSFSLNNERVMVLMIVSTD